VRLPVVVWCPRILRPYPNGHCYNFALFWAAGHSSAAADSARGPAAAAEPTAPCQQKREQPRNKGYYLLFPLPTCKKLMASETAALWNQKYSADNYVRVNDFSSLHFFHTLSQVYGTAPNDFLASAIAGRSVGKAFSVGEGEGRNACFLASFTGSEGLDAGSCAIPMYCSQSCSSLH
jgi:hypothetical protein